jgi:SAM-dependent methyltransferase
MATKLAPGQIGDLDPYKFMAVIGKQVIHPGGRASTGALLRLAQITRPARVLDVGCGVATTAIEIAHRHGAQVTAVDISPLMLERAEANARAAGLADLVTVTFGDILKPSRGRRRGARRVRRAHDDVVGGEAGRSCQRQAQHHPPGPPVPAASAHRPGGRPEQIRHGDRLPRAAGRVIFSDQRPRVSSHGPGDGPNVAPGIESPPHAE